MVGSVCSLFSLVSCTNLTISIILKTDLLSFDITYSKNCNNTKNIRLKKFPTFLYLELIMEDVWSLCQDLYIYREKDRTKNK